MKASTKAMTIPLALATAGAAEDALAQSHDIFLDMTGAGIEGEATDDQYTNAIEVLAWSWNLSRDVVQQPGFPPQLGSPIARDIKVSKYTDKATTELANRLISGGKIDETTLVVRKPLAKEPYIKIKMTSVYVTKIAQGTDESEDRATETIGLNFANVCITYTLSNGTSPGEQCWDVSGGGK